MALNSGSLLFLFIVIGCVFLLTLSLVIIGLASKNKKRISKGAKVPVVIFSILTCLSLIAYPFVYHNYIDMNLRFGYFVGVNKNDQIKITRDSFEYHTNGQSSSDGRGVWTLEENKLVLHFTNNEKQTYYVKDMGTTLMVDGVVVFKYSTNR